MRRRRCTRCFAQSPTQSAAQVDVVARARFNTCPSMEESLTRRHLTGEASGGDSTRTPRGLARRQASSDVRVAPAPIQWKVAVGAISIAVLTAIAASQLRPLTGSASRAPRMAAVPARAPVLYRRTVGLRQSRNRASRLIGRSRLRLDSPSKSAPRSAPGHSVRQKDKLAVARQRWGRPGSSLLQRLGFLDGLPPRFLCRSRPPIMPSSLLQVRLERRRSDLLRRA